MFQTVSRKIQIWSWSRFIIPTLPPALQPREGQSKNLVHFTGKKRKSPENRWISKEKKIENRGKNRIKKRKKKRSWPISRAQVEGSYPIGIQQSASETHPVIQNWVHIYVVIRWSPPLQFLSFRSGVRGQCPIDSIKKRRLFPKFSASFKKTETTNPIRNATEVVSCILLFRSLPA